MMQTIGRLERAITRLEAVMARKQELAARQLAEKDREIARLAGELAASEQRAMDLLERERDHAHAAVEQDPHAINAFSHDKALAALRSLDSLIDDLQKARRDG
jgi:uncharacterized protein YhaN